MITLSGSVGLGAANHRNDVIAIQRALSQVPPAQGGPTHALDADGVAGSKTKSAIFHFQQHHFRWADGRVSARGPTLRALNRAVDPNAPPVGVRPLSSADMRGAHDLPGVPPPATRQGVIAMARLISGECWFTHGTGRTRMVPGHPHPLVAGDNVMTSDSGRCTLRFMDGTDAEIRPSTLVIIHGGSSERVRAEGSRAVVRPGALMGRLRELAGS